jgi:cytochrome oxidase Cu insertion factor (SCO1/SenC/PrrC family)
MRRFALIAGVLAVGLTPLIALVLLRGSHAAPEPEAVGPSPGPYRGNEPPPGQRAPDFHLRSYRGGFASMGALRGKVVLVTFLDTKCTHKCPIIAGEVGEGLRLLSPSERRQTVALAITVDPRVDTPRAIRAFLARRQALVVDYLIGSIQELRPVWTAYYVLPAVDTGNADVHSAGVRVFDRRGIWVSNLHAGVDLTPKNLAHDVRVALKQRVRE